EAQNLAQRGSLAASGDEDGARVGMRQQRRLDERLVVDELVGLGRLDLPIEEERPAERLRVVDRELLETRPLRNDLAADRQPVLRAGPEIDTGVRRHPGLPARTSGRMPRLTSRVSTLREPR